MFCVCFYSSVVCVIGGGRVQAYTSISKGGLNLLDHKELARHINSLVYHSRMVDSLDELLVETSDLSIYWSVVDPSVSSCHANVNYIAHNCKASNPLCTLRVYSISEARFGYMVNLYSDSHGKSNRTVFNMMSLLFVCVVFGPVLRMLIIYYQDAVCLRSCHRCLS